MPMVLAGCTSLVTSIAHAQVTPDRTYFGVNRPMPMTVRVPNQPPAADSAMPTKAWLQLLDPPAGDESAWPPPIASAPVQAGAVDLAALFPELWTKQSPKVRYVQLAMGDEATPTRIGPPVVLCPMVTPATALLVHPQTRAVWFTDPQTGEPNFPQRDGQIVWTTEPASFAGLRAEVDQHVVFDTSAGEIEFQFRPDAAPNTVANFRALAAGGFYTDIIFHRIVPVIANGAAFVVQVGDPTGTGDGGPGYNVPLEPSPLAHDFGVLSMARSTPPDTGGSQVFICLSREGTQRLDGKYTSFAQAVRGEQVILALAKSPVKGDRPIDPPVLKSVGLIDAPPAGTGPAPVKKPVPAPAKR